MFGVVSFLSQVKCNCGKADKVFSSKRIEDIIDYQPVISMLVVNAALFCINLC